MRRTTFALTVGLALVTAAGAASAQSTQRADSAHRRGRWEQGTAQGKDHNRGFGMLLKGITLTEAQKTQLAALRRDEHADKAQNSTERAARGAAMQKAREARQRGDTVAAKAIMRDVRATMQREHEQRVAQIRTILTPDQQKQFDANLAEWKQHAAKRGADAYGARRNGGLKRSGPSA